MKAGKLHHVGPLCLRTAGAMLAAFGRGASWLRVCGTHPTLPGCILLVRVLGILKSLIEYLYKQLLSSGACYVEASRSLQRAAEGEVWSAFF